MKSRSNSTSDITNHITEMNDETTLSDISKQNKQILEKLNIFDEKYDGVNQRMKTLEEENMSLKADMNIIKGLIKNIETEVTQKLKNSRVITVHGIPLKKNENLKSYIMRICEILKVNIKIEQIIDCRRMGTNTTLASTSTPIIIAEFTTDVVMKTIMDSYKSNGPLFLNQLNGDTSRDSDEFGKVFINEYLNSTTKQLFDETKKIQKTLKIKYVWIQNGQLLLRMNENSKVFRINNNEDLIKLKQNT